MCPYVKCGLNLSFSYGKVGYGLPDFLASVAELVDALVLGTSPSGCRFDSCHSHQQ